MALLVFLLRLLLAQLLFASDTVFSEEATDTFVNCLIEDIRSEYHQRADVWIKNEENASSSGQVSAPEELNVTERYHPVAKRTHHLEEFTIASGLKVDTRNNADFRLSDEGDVGKSDKLDVENTTDLYRNVSSVTIATVSNSSEQSFYQTGAIDLRAKNNLSVSENVISEELVPIELTGNLNNNSTKTASAVFSLPEEKTVGRSSSYIEDNLDAESATAGVKLETDSIRVGHESGKNQTSDHEKIHKNSLQFSAGMNISTFSDDDQISERSTFAPANILQQFPLTWVEVNASDPENERFVLLHKKVTHFQNYPELGLKQRGRRNLNHPETDANNVVWLGNSSMNGSPKLKEGTSLLNFYKLNDMKSRRRGKVFENDKARVKDDSHADLQAGCSETSNNGQKNNSTHSPSLNQSTNDSVLEDQYVDRPEIHYNLMKHRLASSVINVTKTPLSGGNMSSASSIRFIAPKMRDGSTEDIDFVGLNINGTASMVHHHSLSENLSLSSHGNETYEIHLVPEDNSVLRSSGNGSKTLGSDSSGMFPLNSHAGKNDSYINRNYTGFDSIKRNLSDDKMQLLGKPNRSVINNITSLLLHRFSRLLNDSVPSDATISSSSSPDSPNDHFQAKVATSSSDHSANGTPPKPQGYIGAVADNIKNNITDQRSTSKNTGSLTEKTPILKQEHIYREERIGFSEDEDEKTTSAENILGENDMNKTWSGFSLDQIKRKYHRILSSNNITSLDANIYHLLLHNGSLSVGNQSSNARVKTAPQTATSTTSPQDRTDRNSLSKYHSTRYSGVISTITAQPEEEEDDGGRGTHKSIAATEAGGDSSDNWQKSESITSQVETSSVTVETKESAISHLGNAIVHNEQMTSTTEDPLAVNDKDDSVISSDRNAISGSAKNSTESESVRPADNDGTENNSDVHETERSETQVPDNSMTINETYALSQGAFEDNPANVSGPDSSDGEVEHIGSEHVSSTPATTSTEDDSNTNRQNRLLNLTGDFSQTFRQEPGAWSHIFLKDDDSGAWSLSADALSEINRKLVELTLERQSDGHLNMTSVQTIFDEIPVLKQLHSTKFVIERCPDNNGTCVRSAQLSHNMNQCLQNSTHSTNVAEARAGVGGIGNTSRIWLLLIFAFIIGISLVKMTAIFLKRKPRSRIRPN